MFDLVSMEASWACSQQKWVRIASTIKKETFIHSTVGKWGTPVWDVSVLRSSHVAPPVEVESRSHIYIKSSESVYCAAKWGRSWAFSDKELNCSNMFQPSKIYWCPGRLIDLQEVILLPFVQVICLSTCWNRMKINDCCQVRIWQVI